MRNLTSGVREKQQIEWRRSQVLDLASQSYNQREICQKLQLDKSAVSRDIQFLRKQARENLQYHIHERGNVFHTKDIDDAIEKGKLYDPTVPNIYAKKCMGIDPAYGSSAFGIVVTQFVKY